MPQVLADWHDRTIGQLLERMADLLAPVRRPGPSTPQQRARRPPPADRPAVHTLLHLVTFGPSPAVTVPEARAAHIAAVRAAGAARVAPNSRRDRIFAPQITATQRLF